jgi:hypothetical protein
MSLWREQEKYDLLHIIFYPPPSGPRVCNNPEQAKYYESPVVFLSFSHPDFSGHRVQQISLIILSVIVSWCPLI